MSDCIVERTDGVMVIKFNRPERMNSLGGSLLSEFNAALIEGRTDDRVRAFVVTGEGRAWNAGADLQAAGSGGGQRNENSARWNALDPIGEVGRTILNIRGADKPTIAAVNGVAVGGGFGLCSAFDIRIASDQARFSTVFIKRALAPDCGLSWFLPRLVGPEHAAEMFFTGRMVAAEEARELGIVSKVVPHDTLMDEAMALAEKIAAQPPHALRLAKTLLKQGQTLSYDALMEMSAQAQALSHLTEDHMEGVGALLEKRAPRFT